MDSQPSCVVVTGFGPFRQYLVNSSWEAVKELSKLGLNSDMEVELRILQLPVDYREVKQRVTRIWEDLQPQGRLAGKPGGCVPDLGFAMLCTLCSRWGWPFSHIRRAEQASVSLISRPPRVRTQLAVHIGLDASAKAIVLEQCAKNRGYRDADIRGFRPARGECLPDGPEVIASEVSMKAVSKRVAVEGVEVTFSRDAGRLCCLLIVGP
uniref:pyroglutamyl-peptidase 1-like protein isoform X4 n=1 Tax=Halichoerus grypus TaxID=9711 RepID=UPI001659D05B|nr:pyroglutamyl-peptidase 1-like protein isoform X4 [Halichoerus grypus]